MSRLACRVRAVAFTAIAMLVTAPAMADPLALASGWGAYGQGYAPPSVSIDDGIVVVGGLARAASSQWSTIATLPANARPPRRLTFSVDNHGKSARIDVFADGRIAWIQGSHDHGWVSLDGIRFVLKPDAPLQLPSQWVSYSDVYDPGVYERPSASKRGNRVLLSGTVLKRSGNAFQSGETIATLPPGLRPSAPLIFNANGGTRVQRIDAYPDGRIVWVGGEHDYPWVSLDGLVFPLNAGAALAPGNGWAAYGRGYPAPAAVRDGGMVLLSGLLTGEGPRSRHIAQLPAGMRPSGRRIFHTGADQYSLRVDIDAEGWLSVEAGAGTGWVTLSGIAFPVAASVAAAPKPTSAAPKPTAVAPKPTAVAPANAVVTAKPVGAAQRQGLALAAGWSAYGEGYSPPSVEKSGNLVMVSGLARASSSQWGHIATLPAGMRPPHELVFNLNNDAATARVDVLPDGRILWIAGGHDHGWLSLSGITFSVDAGTPLALGSGWRDFGPANRTVHGPASVTRTGDLVVASGLIEKPAGGFTRGEVIATLPAGARPAQSLIFNVNGESKTQRLDVAPDGRIYWDGGGHDYNWVSLNGVTFSAAPGATLGLAPGNAPYGSGLAAPQASRIGDMISISGTLKPGDLAQPVLVLPQNLRPAGRMIFNLGSDGNPVRIDILANGEVRHVAGTKAIGWLNLSGIAYPLGIEMPKVADAPLAKAVDAVSGELPPNLSSLWKNRQKVRRDGNVLRADVTIANQPATIVVYQPIAGRLVPNIAVLATNLTVGNLIQPLEGAPLVDDLVINNAAFVFVPKGNGQAIDVSQLPEAVKAQVRTVRTGPIELIEGQNLFALVNAQSGGATAQLLTAIGAPLKDLKVHIGYGRKKVKNKLVPYNKVRLVRAGRWQEPFHLKDVAVKDPTFEFVRLSAKKVLRAWGMGDLTDSKGKRKDYFVFLQKDTAKKGPFPTAAALDASSISLVDYKNIALVFAKTMFQEVSEMQTVFNGIDEVPLDKVTIENREYRDGGAMDEDGNPDFTHVLVMAAAPKEKLPGKPFTEGWIMLAHGTAKVFGYEAGEVQGWIGKKGMDVTAKVDLPNWANMELGKFDLALKRSKSGYAMELEGKATAAGLVNENITLKASNKGLSFALGANCPLRPVGISASLNGFNLKSAPSVKLSNPNLLDCILDPLEAIADALKKGTEIVGKGSKLVKDIGDDAWAGLVKNGGGIISPASIANFSKKYANPSKALDAMKDAGGSVLSGISDAGGIFGDSGGGTEPRYFNKPSACGPHDDWNLKWGTCWRKGYQLVQLALSTNLCMSVDGRKKEKNRDIQIEVCHGDWNQQWAWNPATGEVTHGWGADHCLDSGSKGTSGPGRIVEQNACNGEGDQRFYRDAYDRLVDRDGYCIQADANSKDATLRVQPCKLDASGKQAYSLQKWRFTDANHPFTTLAAAQGCALVAKGQWSEALGACLKPGFDALRLAGAANLCVGVENDGDSNGDPAIGRPCHYRWSQQWQYKDGRIANPIGKCLDYDKSLEDVKAGEPILQRKCEGRSHWGAYRIPGTDEYMFKSRSGFCLAVPGTSNAMLRDCNGDDSAQRFKVGRPDVWMRALHGQRAWCDSDEHWLININFCVENGWKLLRPNGDNSWLCVRIDEDEKGDDARLYPCGGPGASEWKPLWRWNGRAIKHKKGLCLDVQGSKGKDRARVQAYNCKDEAYQHWRLDGDGLLWGIGGTCVGLENGYQKNSKLELRTDRAACVHWTFK